MITQAPHIPASAAAIVALIGFGLIYWALLGLGLFKRDTGA